MEVIQNQNLILILEPRRTVRVAGRGRRCALWVVRVIYTTPASSIAFLRGKKLLHARNSETCSHISSRGWHDERRRGVWHDRHHQHEHELSESFLHGTTPHLESERPPNGGPHMRIY